MSAITIRNLSKRYGAVTALDDVSFEVREGTIFGLIGPNGAGKSTLVKSVLNLIRIDSGEIALNGTPYRDRDARKGVTYLPELFQFYPYYTVESTLNFFAQLQGTPDGERAGLVDSALRLMRIEELRKRKIRGLSKGQLQRTGLASLFTGNVRTIILDEPFFGLDPIGIKELKEVLIRFRQEGRTIFINSHMLSEVQNLCDDIALIHNGRLLETGSVKELTSKVSLEDYFYNLVTGKKASPDESESRNEEPGATA